MLKKLLSTLLALSFVFTCSLSSFAETSSPSKKEFSENGTLVDTRIITTDSGTFKMETYSRTEALPTTRSTEQEYEKTVAVFLTPSTKAIDPFVKDSTVFDAVNLKIRWVTRAQADGLSQYEGYKLSRIIVTTYDPIVDLDMVAGLNHGVESGAPVVYFDLSGYSSPTTITKYPNFSNYVPAIGDCIVGARLSFSIDGSSQELAVSVFDNII